MRVRPYPFEDSEIVTKTLCLSQHYLVASPKLIGEPLHELNQINHYPVLSWAKLRLIFLRLNLPNQILLSKKIPLMRELRGLQFLG